MKCENDKCSVEHNNKRFCSRKCFGVKNIYKVHGINKKKQDEKREKKLKDKLTKEYRCKKCDSIHDGSYGCGDFCSRFCSNSREWSQKKKDKHRLIMKSSKKSLKANKVRSVNKIKKPCVMCGENFEVYECNQDQMFCSRECYNNDTEFKFRKKSAGGTREGSGRGKSGWYKGIQCDSSYELAWVIYSLEHGINFVRNKDGFDYYFNDSKHKYYPDYYLPDTDAYVEIKGFNTAQYESKIKQFNKKLSVLYKKDLIDVFKYVINKYGKNFIEMYEGNPHKIKKNKCGICGNPSKNKYCSRNCSGKALKIIGIQNKRK
jgi:hypothetical protein